MKIVSLQVKSDESYIIPIGDLHYGDKGFTRNSMLKLKGYIEWVLERKNAYIFLNGDILNTATRNSKTSPFSQDKDLTEQIMDISDIFQPVKSQIIGAISGNHEQRIEDFCGWNPMQNLCQLLEIKYCGYGAIVDIKLGKANKGKGREEANATQYTGVFHHTNGGGTTIGSKLNRTEMLRKICRNADFYCGSHNHMLGAVPVIGTEYDPKNSKTIDRIQYIVDCGGYLEWSGSYAEAKALEPLKTGSPRIRLDGKKKDIHVSL